MEGPTFCCTLRECISSEGKLIFPVCNVYFYLFSFYRLKLRGICHLIFYSLPIYAEFYPELVNLLGELAKVEGVSCTVVYSSYDALPLCRIVGTRQAKAMVTAQDNVFTLLTGQGQLK